MVGVIGVVTAKVSWGWRNDLADFRNHADGDRFGFPLVPECFESVRLRTASEAGREAAGVEKHATTPTLRCSFATHLLVDGYGTGLRDIHEPAE